MCRGWPREGVRVPHARAHTEWGGAGNQTTSAALWNMSIRGVGGAPGAGLVQATSNDITNTEPRMHLNKRREEDRVGK